MSANSTCATGHFRQTASVIDAADIQLWEGKVPWSSNAKRPERALGAAQIHDKSNFNRFALFTCDPPGSLGLFVVVPQNQCTRALRPKVTASLPNHSTTENQRQVPVFDTAGSSHGFSYRAVCGVQSCPVETVRPRDGVDRRQVAGESRHRFLRERNDPIRN